MERKIGEIFEYNGEWYQCVEHKGCHSCAFLSHNDCGFNGDPHCVYRSDGKHVIFKKLEKVGEPYMLEDKKFQKYKVFKTPYIYHKIDCSWQSFSDPYYISLEIKEDMEEKKLNLKPFDIQKAREGKPVCTRDGRKARILCFDRLCCDEISTIVACVLSKDGKDEDVIIYSSDGFIADKQHPYADDLMMLPEKKEGWVNVYKYQIHDTPESAKESLCKGITDYIKTIKIEWEE